LGTKNSDTADGLATPGGWPNYYFRCFEKILDVSATSQDGKTYTLTLGKVDVATLTLTDPKSLRMVRSWDPGETVPSETLVVTGVGSAAFNQPDLNAVRMATPGYAGSVILNFGTAQALSYGELDIPRTKTIGNTSRQDKLAICNAMSLASLAKAAPATSDFQLAASVGPEAHFCDSMTADALKKRVVDLNTAIDSGDFLAAYTTDLMLALLFPETDPKYVDFDQFTDDQWHLAYAVGGAVCMRKKDGTFTFKYDQSKKSMLGLQGTANYLELLNDMADCGVEPLASPPIKLDTIYNYYKNVQLETSYVTVKTLHAQLLKACQRVMSGLQVHYRNAGNTVTPTWQKKGRSRWVLFVGGTLVETAGKATVFPSAAEAMAYVAPGGTSVVAAPGRPAKKKSPRKTPFIMTNINAPEGFDASVSRAVYGRRYESSCEGMASFRLRTLPQYFAPVGVVYGSLKSGGIGHCIAVFSGPDGFYLSSNGKEFIVVSGKDLIQRAVEDEFVAIYSHKDRSVSASDFDYGFGVAPAPKGETPAQREPIIDQMLIDGSLDEGLRRVARTTPGLTRAPLDWDNFLPSWV
jgi:hypothetical protein